jgi:demethylmenaquinone methyltransferase/2-methoxy-6-polyprenyl-1,4-benzoquinol methylase
MINKASSWSFFNRIAKRYDLVNRVVSFGQDQVWRRKIASLFPKKKPIRYLDLGTGTGDVLIEIVKRFGLSRFSTICGLDMAENMLEKARLKSLKWPTIEWIHGDAMHTGLPDNSQDVITMAFAIRNVPNYVETLHEIYRVLDKDGQAFILEFSLPPNLLIRHVYLVYFRYVLPWVGGLLSRDRQPYVYLNKTVEEFPFGEDFVTSMKEAGFKTVNLTLFSFGVATLYHGIK